MIERYEFKYLVTEAMVPEIRRTVLGVGRRDPYAGEDGSYTIRSLYLDTPEYHLFWANDRQARDRFKARVRSYPGKTAPTFLEIKRRTGDVIRKTRGVITGDWIGLVTGKRKPTESEQAKPAIGNFIEKVQRYHLEPKMLVEYEREAFASDIDSYGRLTLDRRVRGQACDRWTSDADERRWRPSDIGLVASGLIESPVVIELKFERRPPRWMVAMVKRLELERRAFSKYGYTVETQLRQPVRHEPCGSFDVIDPLPQERPSLPSPA